MTTFPEDYARPVVNSTRLDQLIDSNSNFRVEEEKAPSKDVLGRVCEKFLLQFASASAGGYVVKVDPKFTSQDCSWCGALKANNNKVYSVFECAACGYMAHRDVNASNNLLQRGLHFLSGWVPDTQEAGRLNRALA